MQRTRQTAGNGGRSPLPPQNMGSSSALNGSGDGHHSPLMTFHHDAGAPSDQAAPFHHTPGSAAALLQRFQQQQTPLGGAAVAATGGRPISDVGRSVENILAKVRSASALNNKSEMFQILGIYSEICSRVFSLSNDVINLGLIY